VRALGFLGERFVLGVAYRLAGPPSRPTSFPVKLERREVKLNRGQFNVNSGLVSLNWRPVSPNHGLFSVNSGLVGLNPRLVNLEAEMPGLNY
jgi:hypothetical protein